MLAMAVHRKHLLLALAAALAVAGCGGRLSLPNPDVVGAPSDGRSVVYTLSNGQPLRVRLRTPAGVPPERQEPCAASVYLELGSATFVSMSVAEEQRRRHDAAEPALTGAELEQFRTELQTRLETRRTEMGYANAAAFLAALPADAKDANGIPRAKRIDCNLTLQALDRIYTPLYFSGPGSSNTRVDCECTESPASAAAGTAVVRRCARLESPFTVAELRDLAGREIGEPPVMSFIPTNCGVAPDEPGGAIDARGAIGPRCDPVTNVTVNRCELRGRITARSFSGDLALYSSPRADHVTRLRESAARDLSFREVRIFGRFRTPIHLFPGVHHVSVENSVIRGGYAYSTVYLPADGGWNTFRNNVIYGQSGQWGLDVTEPSGGRREVIAIDGSEHNRIINNRFVRIPYGGIYLYRNCGERSMIRHRPPQYNQIINNVFDYGGARVEHPGVFIGSRDDLPVESYIGVKKYCNDDLSPSGASYPGNDSLFAWDSEVLPNSSESDLDWAGHNVVAQNRFVNFAGHEVLEDIVKLSVAAQRLDTNYLGWNELGSDVDAALERAARGAGCAVHDGVRNGYKPFIVHGEHVDTFWSVRPPIRLGCGTPLLCTDGELAESSGGRCELRSQQAECRVEGSNTDCTRRAVCPAGHRLVGVQAACNLEFGAVPGAATDRVLMQRVKVVRTSTNVSDGWCWANGTGVAEGERRIRTPTSGDAVSFGCREHDRNGGDCHVVARYYCRADSP